MKIVKCNKDYGHSVNFIDENDVFVGFDMAQCCCESFGWDINLAGDEFEDGTPEDQRPNLDGWTIDPSYCQHRESEEQYDEGGAVEFRLKHTDGRTGSLTLYNSHNGYYAHGFDFKNGDETVESGAL